MNETMKLFLMILRSALKDQRPELDRDIPTEQWQALFRLADIHKLLPLFYEAVQALPSLDREQALLADMKQKVRCQVIAQTLRTGEFLTLNDRLQEAGVRPLVVKGIDNLMVAGRCMGAEFFAEASIRVQQTARATGEAAGIGAAMALEKGISPHEVDGVQVREKMVEKGARFAAKP